MESNLDKLIYIYSVDTTSFYNDKEYDLHKQIIYMKQCKKAINEVIKPLIDFKTEANKALSSGKGDIDSIEAKLIDSYKELDFYSSLMNDYLVFNEEESNYKINNKSILHLSEKHLINSINSLKFSLDELALENTGKRTLRHDNLNDYNKISLFESTLTRSLGIKENEISTDIIVVRAYRYAIFEDLIKNGFKLPNGDEYEYFASSAGQIRNKKSCFVKSSTLHRNKCEVRNKLMCGLSINKINKKGGINQNKFQAYLSLTNSASSPWKDFDIDKCIVVDDMELEVEGLVDYINHETYKIKRMKKNIPINFMDGAGIILPSLTEKSFQFRLPFFKGLLVPFDFRKFILHHENSDFFVKDIYGVEHNIFKDNIQIIFTKSQFKLHSYYKDWDSYKDYFKKFKCEASICKVEEDVFEDKPINYQMIQTLNFSDNELQELSKKTVEDIEKISKDKNVMLRLLGADENKVRKNHFQTSLSLYNELLNDEHSKQAIKDRKKSLVKEAKSGKILLEGTKRSYISPDLYAFAEWLFLKNNKPAGLLKDGEVSCKLFTPTKLDVLRSPHLFREHCVRQNVINKETEEWFISNCIYTSVHDMISKQLMFDVDGDDALIVRNELFVNRAERQMKHTVPLEYTLATAKKSRITNENIVNSLKAAYSKNIGEVSNLITKIWNSKKHLNKKDVDLIKILCMENNAIIDFAKTLWMPTRSEVIERRIKNYSKIKVPYFFRYAKDKEIHKVETLNESTMNRLAKSIPNKRINFTNVAGKLNYKILMKNSRQKTNDELSKQIIDIYTYEDRNKSFEIKMQTKDSDKIHSRVELDVYRQIRRKLLQVTNNENYITDVLVKYLFDDKNSRFKDTLWNCFGKEIVRNIENNALGIKRCGMCGIEIEKIKAKRFCRECAEKKEKERKRGTWHKIKNKQPTSENKHEVKSGI